MICKTLCTTFPRSGHGLLINILKAYFENELIYCKMSDHTENWPCFAHNTNFQKNHDYGLINDGPSNFYFMTPLYENLIVQIRNPLESICSLFTLYTKAKPDSFMQIPDTPESWSKNSKIFTNYWISFTNTWIINNNKPLLILPYMSLINNPINILKITVQFMTKKGSVNLKKLKSITLSENISLKHKIYDFKYFQLPYFQSLEKSCESLITQLNLNSYFL